MPRPGHLEEVGSGDEGVRLADELGGGDAVVFADDEGDGEARIDQHLVGAAAVVGGGRSEDVALAGRVEAADLVVEEGEAGLLGGEAGGEGMGPQAALAPLNA